MADIEYKWEGLEPLLAKLKSVSDDAKYKGGRFALRKAANVIAAKVKENAQRVDDPATPDSIPVNATVRWSSRIFRSTGDLGFRVGIQGGARKGNKAGPGGATYYWRFLEFGTQHMQAKPFFRTALSDNTDKAKDTFVTEYIKAIDRAIKRAGR